jgi:hypothetical protein
VIIVWYILSFLPQILILLYIFKTDLSLSEPKKPSKSENPLVVLYKGWKVYLLQKAFLSSLAYVLLYITVLSPGVLLTMYLKINNFSETVIGIFRGVSAISGIFVTFLTPFLIKRLKLIYTALTSIWIQFLSLIVGIICVIFVIKPFSIYILLLMIVVSRVIFIYF